MRTLRSLALNLGLIGYFIWIQPAILASLDQAPEKANLGLALALLAVQGAEILGLWLKYPLVYRRAQANPNPKPWGAAASGLTLIGQIGMTALLAFSTMWAFGIGVDEVRGT